MYSTKETIQTNAEQALKIFQAGIAAVDPLAIINHSMQLDESTLIIRYGQTERRFDLNNFKRVLLIGYGKASAGMGRAVENILGAYIQGGLIVTKYGHAKLLRYAELIEAGHPIPDAASYQAGKRIYELCQQADESTLIINLVSGGGSALLEYSALALETLQGITQELLENGVDIHRINIVRSTLSKIKAGKLAAAMYPAQSINLILSDVLGDDPATIASGPTVYASNRQEHEELTQKLLDEHSKSGIVVKELTRLNAERNTDGASPEHYTNNKSSDTDNLCWNIVIASNYHALLAAESKAKAMGYTTLVLSSRLYGEAAEVGKFYAALAASIQAEGIPIKKPACIIGGGESTVHITGKGKGGRNQEMALSFANEAMQHYHSGWGMKEQYAFASLGSDGNDGPTDAAGAIVTPDLLKRAKHLGLSFDSYLSNNDSYTFFQATEGLHICGPTGTNVCDIQILLMA